MIGIIAAGLACSVITANAQCNAVKTNPCGSRSFTNEIDGGASTVHCTASDGGNWQSIRDAAAGTYGSTTATFTCVWTCIAYDLLGHPHQLPPGDPATEDKYSSVPAGEHCPRSGG